MQFLHLQQSYARLLENIIAWGRGFFPVPYQSLDVSFSPFGFFTSLTRLRAKFLFARFDRQFGGRVT